MPLLIRRRPRVDDSHLPATLHPLLRQIFASRGVEDPALLERSANQLLPPQRLFGMAQAVPLLAEALTAQNAFSSSVTLTATAPPVRRCACWPCAPWAVATSIFWCPTASSSVMASPRDRRAGGGPRRRVPDHGGQRHLQHRRGGGGQGTGMQVLVTDHHLPGQELPDADAIVNPNQHGCDFPSSRWPGSGSPSI